MREKNLLYLLERFWYVFVIVGLVSLLMVAVLLITSRGMVTLKPSPSPQASPVAEYDAATAALEEQGTSDEISEIEADLEATDLSDIDKELTEIESEFTAP